MTSGLKHKRGSISFSMLCSKYYLRLVNFTPGKIIPISLNISPEFDQCCSSSSSSKGETVWQQGLVTENQI